MEEQQLIKDVKSTLERLKNDPKRSDFLGQVQSLVRTYSKYPLIPPPTTFKVGDRTYKLLPINDGNECRLSREVLRELGNKVGAAMGKEDFEYIDKYSKELPQEYRPYFHIFFPDCTEGENHLTALIFFGAGRWIASWCDWSYASRNRSVSYFVSRLI